MAITRGKAGDLIDDRFRQVWRAAGAIWQCVDWRRVGGCDCGSGDGVFGGDL
jgi:hypothetical protein